MARDNTRGPRLDQPMERGLSLRPSVDQEAVGRLSERIARFLGSWRFIGYMTAFVLFWVLWNTIGPKGLRFDEWPFIGLTLLLSLQASYAAPLILLAQNRQADRDRVQSQYDRDRTERIDRHDDPRWRRDHLRRQARGRRRHGIRDDQRAAAIGDHAAIEAMQRRGNDGGIDHVLHRHHIAQHGVGIVLGVMRRRNLDPGKLFRRGAVFVHVPGGDEAEPGRRGAEAVGDFVAAGDAGVAHPCHTRLRAAALAVGDQHDVGPALEPRHAEALAELGLRELPQGVMVYEIAGPMFFGAVEQFEHALKRTYAFPKVLILRLDRVPLIDMTGIQTLDAAIGELKHKNVRVLLCEANERVLSELRMAGLLASSNDYCPTLKAALTAGLAPAAA